MPPSDASVMNNMFPDSAGVYCRKGHEQFADGTALFNSAIADTDGFRKIMVWNGGANLSKMFVILVGLTVVPEWQWKIYEVSTSGTLTLRNTITVASFPIQAGDSLVGEDVMFVSGSSTQYLIYMVRANATGTMFAYDGASWTTPTVTGLTNTNMGVTTHRRRLWFYGTGLTAQYLPINAIAGTVVDFNFGPVFSKGGRIVSMRTWTIDGGEGGTDDLFAVLTDRGQIAFYSGTDPSSAATWQLVGVFDVGEPASAIPGTTGTCLNGQSYMLKYGADVMLTLNDGVASAARVLRGAQTAQDYSISGKINSLIREAASGYGANGSAPVDRWLLTHHSRLKQLILNIPTAAATDTSAGRITSYQYVMNTETGAWCSFDSMGYVDAVIWRGDMYMIANGYYVYRYGQSSLDIATDITFECRQAAMNFGTALKKLVTFMFSLVQATATSYFKAGIDADFVQGSITVPSSILTTATPGALGEFLAIHIKGQQHTGTFAWYSTRLLMKAGGFL